MKLHEKILLHIYFPSPRDKKWPKMQEIYHQNIFGARQHWLGNCLAIKPCFHSDLIGSEHASFKCSDE